MTELISRGTWVTVTGKDFQFPGIVLATFEKRNGEIYYIIQDKYGRTFIEDPSQVEKWEG